MKIKNIFISLFVMLMSITTAFAKEASADLQLEFPEYLKIQTITSPVLIANITDKTGNLQAPLTSRFKVISNSGKKKALYLKSTSITQNGSEDSMFEMGGRVYIAFTNIGTKPRSEALTNCKMGTHPKNSAGVVAYPVTSITGAEHQYQHGEGKYKIYIGNGVTDILVNIGSHVLKNSFDTNDPKGFYQATLSLTESDI